MKATNRLRLLASFAMPLFLSGTAQAQSASDNEKISIPSRNLVDAGVVQEHSPANPPANCKLVMHGQKLQCKTSGKVLWVREIDEDDGETKVEVFDSAEEAAQAINSYYAESWAREESLRNLPLIALDVAKLSSVPKIRDTGLSVKKGAKYQVAGFLYYDLEFHKPDVGDMGPNDSRARFTEPDHVSYLGLDRTAATAEEGKGIGNLAAANIHLGAVTNVDDFAKFDIEAMNTRPRLSGPLFCLKRAFGFSDRRGGRTLIPTQSPAQICYTDLPFPFLKMTGNSDDTHYLFLSRSHIDKRPGTNISRSRYYAIWPIEDSDLADATLIIATSGLKSANADENSPRAPGVVVTLSKIE